jgi:hypothetical protein
VLVAVMTLFFAPLALDRSLWLRDLLTFTYPLKAYLRERMLGGELALWNPRLGLGRPFFGVVQPGVLYPLDVVLLIGYPRGVDLFFALHAFVAAFGMRAWLRARGSDDVTSTFGGALFALSGYYVSVLVGNGTYAVGAAFIPWALCALERLDGAAPRIGVFVALMVLGGDPQAAWFAGALLFAVAATHAQRRRALVAAVAGLALAGALAAVQLVPAVEVASIGRPGGVPLADASHFSFPPQRLVELLWPGAFGTPYSADWPLHRLYDEGTGVDYQPWAAGIYVGLLTPLLAALALARRRAADLALGAVALVAFLIALGHHAPFFALVYRFVPGARLFRYPEKYLLVTTLCGCALAARGLGAALGQRPRLQVLVAAAIVVDLFAHSLALVDYVPSSLYRLPPPPIAAMAPAGLVRVYRPQLLVFDAPGVPPSIAARATLRPDVGVEYGVAPLDAYDNFHMAHEAALFAALKAHPLRLVEVTATRYVLLPPSLFAPQEGLVERRAWPQFGAILAEATHASPRVYLATDARVADDAAAPSLLAAADFVPGRSVVLASGSPTHAEGSCALVEDRPERLRITCESSAPSYAVVADAWFPGWRATVDGAPAPIVRANLAMRAVPVPAGTSTVELGYHPRGLYASAIVSALALLVVVALRVRAYRRRA